MDSRPSQLLVLDVDTGLPHIPGVHFRLLIQRLLCFGLALAWVFTAAGSGVHALEVLHFVCDEHGVAEHVGDDGHRLEGHHLQTAPSPGGTLHDACDEIVATLDEAPCMLPVVLTAMHPPSVTERNCPTTPPAMEQERPRGPPLLAYAAKTSPPRA